MTAFTIFVLFLTFVYVVYFAVMITLDLHKKKEVQNSDEEVKMLLQYIVTFGTLKTVS